MPETKFGKCPWCERHNVRLTFAFGQYDGKLWCDWICFRCLDAARNLPKEVKNDDVQGILN